MTKLKINSIKISRRGDNKMKKSDRNKKEKQNGKNKL